ncbi:hypothetical protein EC991_002129 [Linnemannia zychae]|nr:hypothetical protein EC991_002129 [Linnemannia zychae]
MDSAFTRLFMIQELGCLVASHLTKKDMSHLMRTSRQMFTVMEPSFYRELNTYNKPKGINLWESPNGLEALTRNIHFVKTWNSDLLFFVYYHRALVAFDDINSTPSSILAQSALSSTETSSTLPQLHFETTQQAFQIVPLPPMTELTTARLFLAHSANNIDRCRYFQPEYIDPKAMTLRLCVILEHLPQLRELDVQDLTIQDSWSTRLFMTTLQKMSELTSLSISLSADTAYSGIVALICSSVQPSIRSLSILELYADENSITSGTALTLPSITATPLVNLRYLRLFKWTERTTEDEIMSIFGRCPNLEDLTVVEALIPDKN